MPSISPFIPENGTKCVTWVAWPHGHGGMAMGCVHQKEIKDEFLHSRHRPKGCEECLKIGQG